MKNDINISIAAGEALLFLENSSKIVSIKRLEQFLKFTKVNIDLILNLLVSKEMVSITRNELGVAVVELTRNLPYRDYKTTGNAAISFNKSEILA